MADREDTIFIAGVSSDIGRYLARQYVHDGYKVIGTYRSDECVDALKKDGIIPIQCDVADPKSIESVAEYFKLLHLSWDIFISAIGDLRPIGPFFEQKSRAWTQSTCLNGAYQLALLNSVGPFRRVNPLTYIVFLVGGAISRSFPRYTAYSLGKVQLVKFCELLHDEEPDIQAFSIGTGWVATKIHSQTIAAGINAGENLSKTIDFMNKNDAGTSIADIKACIDWCISQPRHIVGGRNFSVVHDPWRNGGFSLIEELKNDQEYFKLRRLGNNVIGTA